MQMKNMHPDEIDAFAYAWEQLAKNTTQAISAVDDVHNAFIKEYPALYFKTRSGKVTTVKYHHMNVSRPLVWFITLDNVDGASIMSILIPLIQELNLIFETVEMVHNEDEETKYSDVELTCKDIRNGYTNAACIRSAIFNWMREFNYGVFVPEAVTNAISQEAVIPEPEDPVEYEPVFVTFINICASDQRKALEYLRNVARSYAAYKNITKTEFKFATSSIDTTKMDSPAQYRDILNADLVVYRGASSNSDNWAVSYARKNGKILRILEPMDSKDDSLFRPYNVIFAKKTNANMEKSE